jgi:hypothetical protein
MRVPKMVKNGHNSVLHISSGAQEDSCSKKSRTDTKPKTFLESWKVNKNHFRPISEQACALRDTMFSLVVIFNISCIIIIVEKLCLKGKELGFSG